MTLYYNMDTTQTDTSATDNDIDLLPDSIFDFTVSYDISSLGIVTESGEIAKQGGLVGLNSSIIPTASGIELRGLTDYSWLSSCAFGGIGVLNGQNATLEMVVRLDQISDNTRAYIMIGWGDGRASKQDTYPDLHNYTSLNLGLFIQKLNTPNLVCNSVYASSRKYTSLKYNINNFTPLLGEFMVISITNSASSGGILTIKKESTQEILLSHVLGVNFNPPKGSKQLNPKFNLHKNIKITIKSLKIIR